MFWLRVRHVFCAWRRDHLSHCSFAQALIRLNRYRLWFLAQPTYLRVQFLPDSMSVCLLIWTALQKLATYTGGSGGNDFVVPSTQSDATPVFRVHPQSQVRHIARLA